jgi:hypothetical protein
MKSILYYIFKVTFWILKWTFLALALLTVAFFAGGNEKHFNQ